MHHNGASKRNGSSGGGSGSPILSSTQTISPALYQGFADVIRNEVGIELKPGKEAMLTSRISKRIRELGLADQKAYLELLKKSDNADEIVELTNAITTNVTSFFRESDHFTYLDSVVQNIRESGKNRIRVWCAAASTGQEPYTIASVIHNRMEGAISDAKILATDISTNALAEAIAGVYADEKLEPVPKHIKVKYFNKRVVGSQNLKAVSDDLKRMISFRTLNLTNSPFPMKGPLDVVFIRNVLIYFNNETKDKIVNEAIRLLRPGGYLFLGHSEGMSGMHKKNLTSLKPSVYQKT